MNKDELYLCPCCGNKTIGELGCYEICSACNWEDDPVQSKDYLFSGGANSISLNEAKHLYIIKIRIK